MKGLSFDDNLPPVSLRQEHLTRIPGSPLAFRVPKSVLALFDFRSGIETAQSGSFTGALTQDDFRFTRLWWEVPASAEGREWTAATGAIWVPYVSGGSHHPFYADLKLLIKWANDGEELKAFLTEYRAAKGFADQWTSQLNSYKRYFVSGAVWSLRPLNQGSFWLLPSGCIFGNNAPALQTSRAEGVLSLCALMNSSPFRAILGLLMPRGNTGTATLKYNLGYVRAVPLPTISTDQEKLLERSTTVVWQLLSQLDAVNETSHAFHGLSRTKDEDEVHISELSSKLVTQLRAIEECAYEAYGVEPHEMEELTKGTGVISCEYNLGMNPVVNYAVDEPYEKRGTHLALGQIFGRWPHDSKSLQEQYEPQQPFEPIPIVPRCAKTDSISDYIVVEDKGHRDDLTIALERIMKRTATDNVQIQQTRVASLFNEHLQLYSHGKRKAPIYWQFATPSASYSVWCYYHRLTRDTFFRIANDYVTPKVDHEEIKLTRLHQEAGPDPSSAQRKAIDAQETFVAELRAFKTEVTRIAPLWNPNLNDGVMINFAPLWRLVPQHKPWQKECKLVWDKLVKGEYDWAHLAMHLWPERVVHKCKDDRSLAIAHRLEDDFWYEDDDSKWRKREVSSDRVEELIAERASSAIKAALKDLLEAPVPAGQTRRKRSART